MSAPAFDLQSHSDRSDGVLAPAAVVAAAAAAGVELLALTDHDTVEGIEEALAAGAQHGIDVVSAAEISALHMRGPQDEPLDFHILGYCVDHTDAAFVAALEHWRGDRERRAWRMADRLEELGWALDRGRLEQIAAAGRPVGRPHLAAAAFEHPANSERIAAEGLETFSDLLVAYLIEGAPAFVRREEPTCQQAIHAIHAAGGVAVWAHPFWDVEQPERALGVIDDLFAAGLDGVEVFYVTHTREQTELLHSYCSQRGLLMTGSADFHGPDHPHFSRFRAFELYGLEPVLGPIAKP
jgi:predicted metal-dependent phosphoesterase TrpH